MTIRRIVANRLFWLGILGLLGFAWGVMQIIPMEKSNPAVLAEPNWDSPETKALVKAACYDCHSNETVYPWYSDIAPTRLLIRHDVLEGREKMNFSEYGQSEFEVEEMVEVIQEGEMPPWYYTLMHSDAQLSDSQKQALITGLRATFSSQRDDSGDDDGDDD